jgi:dihydroflavonol-4-reductase
MKVLVTGITGLLGGHVAQVLLDKGYAVRGLYRTLPAKASRLPWFAGVEWWPGDLSSEEALRKAADSCGAIIHVAARTDQYPSGLEHYLEANVRATQRLAAVARERGIRLVFVSTANAFAPGSLHQPGTEQNPFGWAGIGSGYSESKYMAQKEILDQAREGQDAVVVNPTFMIGGYDLKPSSGAMILHVLNRRVVVYPRSGGKNFIYVKDAAIGVVQALEKGVTGQAYLLAAHNRTYGDFMRQVARQAGLRRIFVPVPSRLLRWAGNLVSLLNRMVPLPIALNRANAILLTADNYYQANKAVEQLQLPQTPLDVAIGEAIAWFRGGQLVIERLRD